MNNNETKPAEPPFQVTRLPSLGLGASWVGEEERLAADAVIRSGNLFRYYGTDPDNPPCTVARLEKEMTKLSAQRYALGVTSGTAALEVAMGALGIGPGDEVIVPGWSWISCFTAVVRVGAKPVLAEIDESFCLDPEEIPRLCTSRTRAVMIVHYQGAVADMEPILKHASHHNVAVLEDCAQSFGASYFDKPIGSMGRIATFSFQHNKIVTCGEGGAVVTSDPRLYERAVRMSDAGQYRPHHQSIVPPREKEFSGSQFRMPEINAAIALAQFRKAPALRAQLRSLKATVLRHIDQLPGLSFRPLPDPEGELGLEIYCLFERPEKITDWQQRLTGFNIPCRKLTGTYCHYWREYCSGGLAHAPGASPFRNEQDWPAPGYRPEDFPRTEKLIKRFMAVPMAANYREEDAEYIGAAMQFVHSELGA